MEFRGKARAASRPNRVVRACRMPVRAVLLLVALAGAVPTLAQDVTPVERVGEIPDQTLILGQAPESIHFGDAFTGTIQRCDVLSSQPGVVTVEKQDGFNVLLTAHGLGRSEVTVTVGNTNRDGVSTSADVMFYADVVDAPPETVGAIEDVRVRVGQTKTVELAAAFAGANLEFQASTPHGAAALSLAGSTLSVRGLEVGVATVTVTASNTNPADAVQTFRVVVLDTVPRRLATLDDLTLEIGQTWSTDIADAFGGTNLTFAAATEHSAASVELDGTVLTVTGVAVGEAVVSVTASNPEGEVVQRFTVTVVDVAPAISSPLGDLELRVGESWTGDLAGNFTGTNLDFEAATADAAVSVSVDGTAITIEGLAAGTAAVTVTVSNSAGSVASEFLVVVRDVPAEVVTPFEDITLIIGETRTLALNGRFAGSALVFGASADDPTVATGSVDGTALTIEALALGGTAIEVVASNAEGEVSSRFQVTVVDAQPIATNQLDDIVLALGAQRSFDLSSYFGGTSLVFTANGGNAAVGETLTDTTLVVDGTAVGRARINVTARNSAGTARQSFLVTVALAPSTTGTLNDVTLHVGDDAYDVDVAGYFAGEPLAFAVESSNARVAPASISGTQLIVTPVVEGATTVTVSAWNVLGRVQLSFVATVVSDPDEVAALDIGLAAVGRNILSSATAAINGRFASAPASTATCGSAAASSAKAVWQPNARLPRRSLSDWRPMSSAGGWRHDPTQGSVGQDPFGRRATQALGEFAFALDAAPDVGPCDTKSWAYWGQGDVQRFEGASYDGVLTSVYIGSDADFGERWRGGVSVSRSVAEVDYWLGGAANRRTGVLETELVSVFPYVSWQLERGYLWSVLGAGWGEATSDRADLGRREDADLSMWMAALGGRHQLNADDGGVAVSLVEDVGLLSLITDGGRGAINDRSVRVGRARVGLEAARAGLAKDGLSFTPFVAAMARNDFGDGETGTGLDLAAGVRYKNQPLRIGFEAKGHMLATHSSEDYEESGVNLTVSVLPLSDGSGLRLSLSPRWGHDDQLTGLMSPGFWSGPGCCALEGVVRPGWSVDATAGYGILSPRLRGIVVPFAELRRMRHDVRAAAGGGVRVGMRYALAGHSRRLFNVEFSAGQTYRLHRELGHVEVRAEARF